MVHDLHVRDAILQRRFIGRRWSWIARYGDLFLKIPRVLDSALSEVPHPDVVAAARYEFEALQYLSSSVDAVVRPLGLVERYGCVVLPRIEGKDLRTVLLESGRSAVSDTLLAGALWIGAEINKLRPPADQNLVPKKDYQINRYLPQGKLKLNAKWAPIAFGFEVRNFMVGSNGRLFFFDPHELSLGYAEEDVTRFLISALMLTWGRPLPVPWGAYRIDELLNFALSGDRELDWAALRYCLKLNVAMRAQHASSAIERLHVALAPVANMYKSYFFNHITRRVADEFQV